MFSLACLLITNHKYKLFRDLNGKRCLRFDPRYVQLAVEYSAADILFYLFQVFPESVAESAKMTILPLLMSFSQSTVNLQANMQMIIMILPYMSYRQAADILERLNSLLQSDERS